jgi:hypothetical protein
MRVSGLEAKAREKSSASIGDRTPVVQSEVKTLYWGSYRGSYTRLQSTKIVDYYIKLKEIYVYIN